MKDTMIGVDLAKNVTVLHGTSLMGEMRFRKKLSRGQFIQFMQRQPAAVFVLEACGSAYYWSRELMAYGHEVKLIALQYVRPFVKRQKNDAADAEAIAIAARQPEMRFVEPKTPDQQANAVLFRARERVVRQRTELVNALRAVLYEFGQLSISRDLRRSLRMTQSTCQILVREECRDLLAQIDAKTNEAFAPAMGTFRCGRDFAAWLGLVPRQFSSGGKERLGRVSKAGQADIRRLLIIGAMSHVRAASRKPPAPGSWLARMLARKPKMLVAVKLANKMARRIWAMVTKQEDYREQALMGVV